MAKPQQPSWIPDTDTLRTANVTTFAAEHGVDSYDALWRWSIGRRAEFWQAVIDRLGIVFREPPDRIFDGSRDPATTPGTGGSPGHGSVTGAWLPGAQLNIVESCFNHDAGSLAVIHRRGGKVHRVSYGRLEADVGAAAQGFRTGHRVAIAMPMTYAAVVAYLAVVKAGGVVVSVADSFSADEIATRLRIGGAETVVTQDVVHRAGRTLPMAEKVWEAGAPRTIVVPAGEEPAISLRASDVAWSDFGGTGPFEAVATGAASHTNILFSSGTTGEPKAIPWTHTTPIKAAMDGHLHQDIRPGDVACWPTNLGWMMGPWLIYASLINGAAMALFDDAPTGRGFGEFVRDAGVTMLGVVPSLVAAWRSSGCMEGLDWSRIRAFSSTGEASNESDMRYLMALPGGRPVIEYCGGTEVGGGYLTGTVVQPAVPGTFTTPALGLDVVILDDEDLPADEGELFLVPPSIGLSEELLNGDHRAVYYDGVPRPGLRRHGDRFVRLPDGHYRAMGRADDTMNLGGIKVSSAELERAVLDTPGLEEVAAVAVPPPGGGPDRLVLFAVPEAGHVPDPDAWRNHMRESIRRRLNPLFKISDVIVLDALPRTASNKVMRRELRRRLVEREP